MHEEASLTKRRKKVRGTGSIQQLENMYMISPASLSLPERPRLHFQGTNLGNVIAPVALRVSPWTATVKAKRDIYTKKYRIAVGGQNPANEKVKRSDTDVEPVFHWDTDPKFYESLLHDYFVKNVIDLTPGAGTMALTCVKKHVGYLGLCMSEEHLAGIRAVLLDGILAAMQEEGSGLYQPRLATALNPDAKEPAPKPKAKAKAAAGGKRGRTPAKDPEAEGDPPAKDPEGKKPKKGRRSGASGKGAKPEEGKAEEDDEEEDLSDFSFSELEEADA